MKDPDQADYLEQYAVGVCGDAVTCAHASSWLFFKNVLDSHDSCSGQTKPSFNIHTLTRVEIHDSQSSDLSDAVGEGRVVKFLPRGRRHGT